jgi:hypothetical protein
MYKGHCLSPSRFLVEKKHQAQFLKLKQPSLRITQPDNNQVGLYTCNIFFNLSKTKNFTK